VEAVQALTQFLSINRTRIERLRELAPKSQQDFFDLLALLFHLNSEDLPGYVSDDTPVGIVNYQPSNAVIDAAKLVNPHFNFKRRPFRHYPLLGVYLINDLGIIHYNETAEFELWLVHDAEISHLELLQLKLAEISEWARSLNITLHTRLISEESVVNNTLSAEDLSRFYLNGLVLAGSIPLWWTVSPEQEQSDYAQAAKTITQQRVLGHASIIDFGPLAEESTQHLLDQSASLLLSSFDQGLEPVLNLSYSKLLLDNAPNTSFLCHHAKQALFQGSKEPLYFDTNTLKLQAVMTSPTVSSEDKLLAQQSLYVLFNERLSQNVSQARYPWRREFIKQLASSWQWPQHHSQLLDQRQNSSYRQCLSEFQQVSKLHLTVRDSLDAFAKKHALKLEQQNQQLKQKHQLFHDVAPDTIPYLPSALLPKNTEQDVYLHRFNNDGEWFISDMPLESEKEQALFKASSLLNVITWAVRNHILTKPNRLKIADHTKQITASLVLELVQQLLRSPLSEQTPIIAEALLNESEKLEQVMLFVNFENEGPQDKLSQQGLVVSSLQNDPLNYALKKQNLVFTIEGLITSSWGQWHYFSHRGNTATLEMMSTILLWQPSKPSIELTKCWCPSESYGKSIESRIARVYSDVTTHYKSNSESGEYLISIAENDYSLQWQPGSCDYTLVSRKQDVIKTLATKKTHFTKTKVDPFLDPSGLFGQLLRLQLPNQITLFLSTQKKIITLYLLDDLGTLYQQEFSGLTESTLNTHFHRFLSTLKQKNNIERLRFYRLTKTRDQGWKLSAMPLTAISQQEYLPITIEMASSKDNAQCTIHCGTQKFSGKADDRALFQQVNELVISLIKSNDRYPLYITDLSFPQDVNYSTYHYISQKQRLESLLNY